ncbi:hypothetical protein B0H10DRAFT_104330 [Mycena sp. CBHHK59/15]|nr:hypothetical protein B0H10DRAFT_104330 [Mycena sp. CBHHK59/15]
MAGENESPAPPAPSETPDPAPLPTVDAPIDVPVDAEPSGSSAPPTPSPEPENRAELLSKARAFLHQPQIQREDVFAKRRFLAEKGLNETEIQGLMRELPVQIPAIPPRSYPQPPPSNLPILLLGLARLFSLIAGGSTVLVFLYHRLFLPRIRDSFMARNSLKSHQLSLLRRLNASLASLKESQSDVATVLPMPELHKEPTAFAACQSIDGLLEQAKKQESEISSIPAISLLRCGISDFRKGTESRNPRTEDLFRVLEGKIPWLVSEEGAPFENHLWETLSTCPLFLADTSPSPGTASPEPPADAPQSLLYWAYSAPEPPPPTALATSLAALSAAVPKPSQEIHSTFQHALQSLTDFTGYISSQIYTPYRPLVNRFTMPGNLSPAEEEMRKEIRALKGLVLNRRSFMPAASPRPQ